MGFKLGLNFAFNKYNMINYLNCSKNVISEA